MKLIGTPVVPRSLLKIKVKKSKIAERRESIREQQYPINDTSSPYGNQRPPMMTEQEFDNISDDNLWSAVCDSVHSQA